ncbi:hypothetical protein N6H14_33690 [Paenibacillus sp. CC-CFT747]|nr:hypothetical protein N6H14_33690 [Paenibacillus sp. CC-CFT747]
MELNGRVIGDFTATGYVPACAARFRSFGQELPADWFAPEGGGTSVPFETWMLVVVFVFAFSAVMGGAEIISTRRNLNALNRRMRPLYTAEARRKKSVLDRYEAKLAHSDYGSELGEKLKEPT